MAVFDKGLFSFADAQHKSWPIIVVTNPKPLLTVQPCKEPVELMATSSHIRMFIFSPSPIQVCEVLQFNRLIFYRLKTKYFGMLTGETGSRILDTVYANRQKNSFIHCSLATRTLLYWPARP